MNPHTLGQKALAGNREGPGRGRKSDRCMAWRCTPPTTRLGDGREARRAASMGRFPQLHRVHRLRTHCEATGTFQWRRRSEKSSQASAAGDTETSRKCVEGRQKHVLIASRNARNTETQLARECMHSVHAAGAAKPLWVAAKLGQARTTWEMHVSLHELFSLQQLCY